MTYKDIIPFSVYDECITVTNYANNKQVTHEKLTQLDTGVCQIKNKSTHILWSLKISNFERYQIN